MIRRVCASLILSFTGMVAFAINPVMKFKDYNTTDGLSSDMVTSVVQDHAGFIWVGTSSGLDRFDGRRFQHYDLPSVTVVTIDKSNNMWVGTSVGLYYFSSEDGTVHRLEAVTDFGVQIVSSVNDLEIDESDNVWVATEGQGVLYYDKKSEKLSQYSRHISISTDIEKNDDGSIIVCAEGSNIFKIKDGEISHLHSFDLCKEHNRELRINAAFYRNGKIYVAPEHEPLMRLDSGKMQEESIKGVLCMTEYDGELSLVASSDGLYLYDFDTGRSYPVISENNSLVFSYPVSCLYKDCEGGVWIGTYGRGLYYIPVSHKEIGFQTTSSLLGINSHLAVTCFTTDDTGNLLVGTKEGYILRVEQSGHVRFVASDIQNIQCMERVDNVILAGSSSDGLYVINDKGKVANYHYERFDKKTIPGNNVRSIKRTNDGIIWVGTEWGLCTFNLEMREFSPIVGDAGKLFITDIIEDEKSRLWMSTANGRIIMTGPYRKKWQVYNIGSMNLSSCVISCLYEDQGSQIIAGTDIGLFLYDEENNRFVRQNVNFPGGTENTSVLSVQQDDNGTLWLSCSSCILGLSYDFSTKSCIVSSEDLGDCLLLPDSSIRLSDGTICFGGTTGYYYFRPESFVYNKNSANLMMSQVLVNGSPVNISSLSDKTPLKLSHKQNNLSFDFALLNLSAPEKNSYYYMLEGRDPEFVYSGDIASVKYDNLSSGRYVFKVKAENNDGKSAFAELEFPIIIKKRWFLTYVAIVFYIMLLISACLISVRIYQKKKERLVYDSKMSAYGNFATDVRDSVTLITVPLLKLLKNPELTHDVKEYLQAMERTSVNLLNTIDHLLYFNHNNQVETAVNIVATDLVSLINDAIINFIPLADKKGISIDMKLPSSAVMYPVDPKRIQSICATLLSNALKSAETKICVEFIGAEESFSLNITNDGKMKNDKEESLGLTIAYQFAEDHSGSLTVGCKGNNTISTLNLPCVMLRQEETVDDSDVETMKTILYLDENSEMRKMVTKLLSPYYKVISTASSQAGLDILNDVPIKFMLCDVKLSDMSGYEFCHMVKNDTHMSEIPFVFLTSKVSAEDKLKGFEAGADDYIQKPFDPELLVARIRNILFNRNKLRDLYTSISGTTVQTRSDMTIANKEFLDKLTTVILDRVADDSFYIDDLATAMFLSKSSLYRRVKSLLGISPIDYIKKVRLHKAAEMLSSGDYEIGEVWHQVGFTSLAYFATCFKKEFDMTPSKYAASQKENIT